MNLDAVRLNFAVKPFCHAISHKMNIPLSHVSAAPASASKLGASCHSAKPHTSLTPP
jgi:hypothetical protein